VPNPVHLVLKSGNIVGLANHTVLIARNGNEYQIADSAAPIRNRLGQITGVVLVFHDVTEQHRQQALLAAHEAEMKRILMYCRSGCTCRQGRALSVRQCRL